MKAVVAFANGKGGRIIFGVDDKTHQVIGIPREIVFSGMEAITAAISDSCEPLIILDVYLQQIEDKAVIVVEISPGKQRPYYIKSLGIKGGTYIRVAGIDRLADYETDQQCGDEEQRQFAHGDPVFVAVDSGSGGAHGGDGMRGRQERAHRQIAEARRS